MAPSPRVPDALLPRSTFAAEHGERLGGGLHSVQSPEPARNLVPIGERQGHQLFASVELVAPGGRQPDGSGPAGLASTRSTPRDGSSHL